MTKHFVHEFGVCETEAVGEETRIWAFCHVLPGARIGKNCNLCDHVFVENDVIVGDNVTIKSGVQLWDGIRLEDDVFVGPNVTFTNDRFPRSKQYPEEFLPTTVEHGASIGANATILPGVVIGANAMIGAGAVVTKSVPPNAIVTGNPAVITGYQGIGSQLLVKASVLPEGQTSKQTDLDVRGCKLWRIPLFKDLRGNLAAIEFSRDLPFRPLRSFLVFGVPSSKVRGEHAHHRCHQFLVAVHGELSVVVDDGENAREVRLDSPEIGLHIPPMVWGIQYKFSANAVLMVMASDPYDADDYIRSYSHFRDLTAGRA
ncbi:WxcM-like domain-containing protein [uncultured Nitratireductor sp.]|uniref:WxcM-like domain-containing protein n=1 Tax=uncultured Nitratireductor sp. TaxID=520953 RepID=UPI00260AA2F4|nr:WxcM-like domain-containing protein [uncultured Nitratireductor sp.]